MTIIYKFVSTSQYNTNIIIIIIIIITISSLWLNTTIDSKMCRLHNVHKISSYAAHHNSVVLLAYMSKLYHQK